MRKREEIESAIFAAAQKRFSRQGYGKTSMAEIASDCSVSPAHLYNFFPSKLDIAAAITIADAEELSAALTKIAERKGTKAPSPLKSFLMTEMRERHKKISGSRGAVELVERVSMERPEAASTMASAGQDALADLLQAAAKAGELKVRSGKAIADAVYIATSRFRNPWVLNETPLKQLEKEADAVIGMITDGLRKR